MLNDSRTQLEAWIARMNDGDNAAKHELLRMPTSVCGVWPERCCGRTSLG